MPMPLLLLKLYWIGKILKFPFAALVGTIREYRGRETRRVEGSAYAGGPNAGSRIRLQILERTFFQSPWKAMRDRRFWIRGVTNFTEMMLHIMRLWAWPRNAFLRRTRAAFTVWNPHRTHEHHLFEEVEYASWGRVLARSWRWFCEGFLVWHGPAKSSISARPHGWHSRWREVHFDGADVAVFVGRRRWWTPLREFRRRGGVHILRVQYVGPNRARATLMSDAGEVLQTITLGAAGD